jgi:DnaJ like chaperone protein
MSIWSRIGEAFSAIGDSIVEFLQKIVRSHPRAPEKSIAFTIGMIALGAKMAKADGIVTANEVAAFKQVFQVPPEELKNVARVFNLAKQDVAGYDAYARQMARLFKGKPEMLEDVLDGLFYIAKADGNLHAQELAYLENVAIIFGFDKPGFSRIRARHDPAASEDPFLVLGIGRAASNDELKRHYKKLVRDNHPDKHIAAGMPEEMVAIATNRLARINAAYDQIAKERGL